MQCRCAPILTKGRTPLKEMEELVQIDVLDITALLPHTQKQRLVF